MIDYFVNCDWGTTHFRLRLVNGKTGDVFAQLSADDGVAELALQATGEKRAELFRVTLHRHVRALGTQVDVDVSRIPIIISGMASSSIGWRELPYAMLPFSLDAHNYVWQDMSDLHVGGLEGDHDHATQVSTKAGLHAAGVFLMSGVRADSDVLRGEETEAIGVAQLPEVSPLMNNAVLLLPGTHSKHIQVVDRQIVDFNTHMTGELYYMLRHHSSLLHSTRLSTEKDNVPLPLAGPSLETFREGLYKSKKAPLPTNLFQVRSRQLLDGCDPVSNTVFLSGLLIGAELLTLRQQWPGKRQLVLCAGRHLHEPYRIALETLYPSSVVAVVPPTSVARLSAIGQAVAFKQIFGTMGIRPS